MPFGDDSRNEYSENELELDRVFEEGAKARKAGASPETNPYPDDSERRKSWDNGWSLENRQILDKLVSPGEEI
jgi:ribosome modulation factor